MKRPWSIVYPGGANFHQHCFIRDRIYVFCTAQRELHHYSKELGRILLATEPWARGKREKEKAISLSDFSAGIELRRDENEFSGSWMSGKKSIYRGLHCFLSLSLSCVQVRNIVRFGIFSWKRVSDEKSVCVRDGNESVWREWMRGAQYLHKSFIRNLEDENPYLNNQVYGWITTLWIRRYSILGKDKTLMFYSSLTI